MTKALFNVRLFGSLISIGTAIALYSIIKYGSSRKEKEYQDQIHQLQKKLKEIEDDINEKQQQLKKKDYEFSLLEKEFEQQLQEKRKEIASIESQNASIASVVVELNECCLMLKDQMEEFQQKSNQVSDTLLDHIQQLENQVCEKDAEIKYLKDLNDGKFTKIKGLIY